LTADAFMPSLAPLAVVALLGAGLALAATFLGAAVAVAARWTRLARGLGAAGLSVAVVYATLLAAVALFSRDRTLPPGERKYFCEVDCHIAYDVVAAEATPGGGRAVTLRTWFDPSTIAPFRGNGPLAPGPRAVFLVDGAGRRREPSAEATAAWQKTRGGSTPLGRELRPGESYTTTFVFEPPFETPSPRLFVADPAGELDELLIGHENSPWHGKIYLALPAPRPSAG
jgi:hypothetical protein